ncbi:TPA: hypothetical protein DCZ90_03925, partial [Candidatus Amesbacteria bacterium]|nr:hypothetical protein [Candidatus Amesbacteria bacterium]
APPPAAPTKLSARTRQNTRVFCLKEKRKNFKELFINLKWPPWLYSETFRDLSKTAIKKPEGYF